MIALAPPLLLVSTLCLLRPTSCHLAANFRCPDSLHSLPLAFIKSDRPWSTRIPRSIDRTGISMSADLPLKGSVALVAGATRGAGRQIAVALGEKGATVWCTGRSVRGQAPPDRPETIEETSELVTAAGGEGHWARVDHTDQSAVQELITRIETEHGKLNILINDVWGGDSLTGWGPFWEHDLANGLRMIELAVLTHVITARLALPLMLKSESSLVVEITDGVGEHYRGSLFYDLCKANTRRLAFSFNSEISKHGHTAVAVTPGFLRSEAMLDLFKITEETWKEGAKQDIHFQASETPRFVGRGIACLAADSERSKFGGQTLSSGWLGERYGINDLDGSRPHFGLYAVETLSKAIESIPEEDRAKAIADVDSLSAAVGDAAAFVATGGQELINLLQGGVEIQEAVTKTVRIG